MKNRGLVALALTTFLATGFSSYASAGALSCADTISTTTRTWSFNSADACGTGQGNPNASSDIEGLGGVFNPGADNWPMDNAITQAGDPSAFLNVSLLTGAWGSTNITATWTLAAGFWQIFGKAVFSVHVGNGSEAIDDFGAFFITQGQYSGTWSFNQVNGQGGLSNARLWTAGKGTTEVDIPSSVPEPGMLLLLGSGLLGLGLRKGRKAKA